MSETEFQDQMSKEFKLIARKKLYFAIAVGFGTALKNFKQADQAVNVAKQMLHNQECDCGQCQTTAQEVFPHLLSQRQDALKAMYCIVESCRSYRQAFGEYPEFVSFLVKPQDQDGPAGNIEEMFDGVLQLKDTVHAELVSIGKQMKIKDPPPDLTRTAFGSNFIKVSERIKLKGEV